MKNILNEKHLITLIFIVYPSLLYIRIISLFNEVDVNMILSGFLFSSISIGREFSIFLLIPLAWLIAKKKFNLSFHFNLGLFVFFCSTFLSTSFLVEVWSLLTSNPSVFDVHIGGIFLFPDKKFFYLLIMQTALILVMVFIFKYHWKKLVSFFLGYYYVYQQFAVLFFYMQSDVPLASNMILTAPVFAAITLSVLFAAFIFLFNKHRSKRSTFILIVLFFITNMALTCLFQIVQIVTETCPISYHYNSWRENGWLNFKCLAVTWFSLFITQSNVLHIAFFIFFFSAIRYIFFQKTALYQGKTDTFATAKQLKEAQTEYSGHQKPLSG